MATITGITMGGSTTTATMAWPIWYSAANTTANSTTGAWINVLCGTWNRLPIRVARESEDAIRRAERLLIRHLNRSQRMMYRSERRFVVVSRDRQRMYEITYRHAHNVFALENGERVSEMCVVPRSIGCPIPDVMLAQKLWIEHMEADMVARANIWDVRDGRHRQIYSGVGPQVVVAA